MLRSMKTIPSVSCFCLAAIFFVFVAGTVADVKFTVGISLPLTGPAAAYGTDLLRVITFFNDRGPNFSLVIEDDQCDPKRAVTIAQKFTTLDRVSFVFGMPCSGTVLASATVYERAKTPVIAIGPGAPALTNLGRYIFRTRPSTDGSVCLLAHHVATRHKRLSLIVEQTEFAQGLAKGFLRYLNIPEADVRQHDYFSSDTDLSQLAALTSQDNSDGIVVFSQAEPTLARVVKSIRGQRINTPIYSDTFPGSPTFLRLGGQDADGIEYSVLAPAEEMLDEEGRRLLKLFETEKGPFVTLNYGFGLTEAAFVAANQALHQPLPISDFLHTTTLKSSIGSFRFDQGGDLVGIKYVLRRIQNGVPATLPSREQSSECLSSAAKGGE